MISVYNAFGFALLHTFSIKLPKLLECFAFYSLCHGGRKRGRGHAACTSERTYSHGKEHYKKHIATWQRTHHHGKQIVTEKPVYFDDQENVVMVKRINTLILKGVCYGKECVIVTHYGNGCIVITG